MDCFQVMHNNSSCKTVVFFFPVFSLSFLAGFFALGVAADTRPLEFPPEQYLHLQFFVWSVSSVNNQIACGMNSDDDLNFFNGEPVWS